jgi:hypothetical protein
LNKLKHYRVEAASIIGKRKRIYRKGDYVTEQDFYYGHAAILEQHGKLTEVLEPGAKKIAPIPLNKERIKVVIVTAVWKRPEIFELFAKSCRVLIEQISESDIEIVVAGSEGLRSRKMVEQYGFHYVEVPNDPLATKHNAAMLKARTLKPDYVLCVGSDDLIPPDLFREYLVHMKAGIDFIGVTDFYFYDTASGKSAYWGGYRDPRRIGHTAGAGRVISARLLSLWDWKPWEIRDSKVLDNSMQNKLRTTPHSALTFSLKEKGLFALDVKSSTNMTPFQLWDNTVYILDSKLKKHFPYVWDSSDHS